MPKTPNSWKVFKSAWAPAPPVASDPAMVRASAGATIVMELSCHLDLWIAARIAAGDKRKSAAVTMQRRHFQKIGGPCGARTRDPRIKSPMLYQLS